MTNDVARETAAYLAPEPEMVGEKRHYYLGAGETTIGRNPTNTIHLGRGAVSRFHARIEMEDGDYFLSDLNSSNGTYLNSHRIHRARLRSGDILQFGDRVFRFVAPSQKQAVSKTRIRFASGDPIRVYGQQDTQPIAHVGNETPQAAEILLNLDKQGLAPTDSGALLAHRRVSLLYYLSNALRVAKDEGEALQTGMDMLFEALPADRGAALLQVTPDGPLEPLVVRRGARDPDDRTPVSHTIIQRVLDEKVAIVCRDAMDDSQFQGADSIQLNQLRSVICVPLLAQNKALGAIQIETSDTETHGFDRNDLEFSAAVANEVAITVENLRLNREAIRNERITAIGLTITNVAHNIKNILLLNQGASELMDINVAKSSSAKLQKSWALVRKCLSHMNELASDMLNYANVRPRRLVQMDINKCLLANRPIFEECLAKKGVVLNLQLQDDLPLWVMDEMGLQRALINLVVNASDAIDRPEGGEVTITTLRSDQGRLEISVSDNGCGVPDDSMKQIFKLFYTTKKTRGTGLGLPMIQKFVEGLGGEITLESEVGQGSTFTMIFPVIEEPREETQPVRIIP